MRSQEELLGVATKAVESALEKGFEEAAAKIVKSKTTMVKFFENTLSVTQSWDVLSVSLYLARDKRVFVVSATPTKIEDVASMVSRLSGMAAKVKESFLYAPLPSPANVKALGGLVDRGILEALKDPADVAERAISAALEEGAEKVAGTITLSYREKVLVTSKGAELYEEGTSMQSYVRAFAGRGSGQWSYGSLRLDERGIERAARIAAKYAADAREPGLLEPGTYDVVLSPMVFGNLLNYVASMSSAYYVMIGFSFLSKDKVGEKVASESLTLYDDPRNRELAGATAFDDEGVPTMSKPIIERGVLRTLLHNTKTAAKMGTRTTGNAGWISPHPWNLRVRPGDRSLEELVADVKRGVLVTNNWYTRLQSYVEGVFSTIARDAAFLIEDGEIKRSVEKFRIADTFPRLLSNIEALGKETFDVWWWEVDRPTRAPYVLVRSINISRHMA